MYENWTDVSGVYAVDPRIVENPRSIPQITYAELRELSYMGANVLHEETVFPVQALNIPINIKILMILIIQVLLFVKNVMTILIL